MIKSNFISSGWVTHNLEQNNTKEYILLLWGFFMCHQASQPGDPIKGLGIPRESDFEGQWDLVTGLPQDWEKDFTFGGQKQNFSCTKTWGKEQWPQARLNQTYLLVSDGLLWKHGSAVAHHGDEALAAAVLEGVPWHKSPWGSPLQSIDPRDGLTQAKQLTRREHNPKLQQKIGLKLYWA